MQQTAHMTHSPDSPVYPITKFKNYPDVLNVRQAAELLSVCKNTVYKLLKDNELPCRRIGSAIRIRKKDVLSFMDSSKIQ